MLPEQYDALILLHILEHLYKPEETVERLLAFVKDGGIVIGGCPSVPERVRHRRERRLRTSAQKFGHISAFSPRRLKELAKELNLTLELLTGAYLLRMTGSVLENHRVWRRLNLLFGAVCPGWPGELYWAMRKRA